jgi:hypothetical protein
MLSTTGSRALTMLMKSAKDQLGLKIIYESSESDDACVFVRANCTQPRVQTALNIQGKQLHPCAGLLTSPLPQFATGCEEDSPWLTNELPTPGAKSL